MPDPAPSPAPTWRQRLGGHLALARLSNSPTVVSNALAGAALAGAGVFEGVAWTVALAMVAFYTAGMYLNDVCDYAIDRAERADRPLVTGLVSRRAALAVAVALFAVGLVVLAGVAVHALLAGLVLVALIVGYDLWHKTNPLSPLLMATTRAMVYVTAYAAFADVRLSDVPAELLWAGALMLAYVVGLTFIAKSETRPTFTRYWPAALLALPALFFLWALPPGRDWILVAVFAAWIAYSARFVYRGQIGAGITRLIAGIALLDVLVLAWQGAPGGPLVAATAFGLTLFLQRYIKGT